MRILVTGATGFIGSNLVEELIKQKYKIKVLIRKKELGEIPKNRKDSLELLNKLKVEVYEGDLLDKQSLEKCVDNVNVIFHLAAIARPMAISNELYFKINEQGTRNLLEICKEKKLKKIIIMSSVSAVGQANDGEAVNEKTFCNPVDVYGFSKLAQEKVALEYFQKYNMPIVILRPPMVFGPRDFEMLKLFRAVNKRFFPINEKEKCMEFLYVGNLVDACLLAMKKGKNGEKYHITNGEHYSINEVINSISKAENKKVLPIKFPNWSFALTGQMVEFISKIFRFHPPFKHDTINWMTQKLWYSDMSKAKKELGYEPKISLDEGVKRTVNYYKQRGLL